MSEVKVGLKSTALKSSLRPSKGHANTNPSNGSM